MNNFRFTKIIAGVSPILAKETVLSKIINMVDAFRLTLSKGYDDNNKKYIDTLMKLDNSKTVILETKGIEIRIKNTWNIPVKKGEKRTLEYSEYAQEGVSKLYIDYPNLWKMEKGSTIELQQSKIKLKILSTQEDTAEVEIADAGRWEVIQYDRIILNEAFEEETAINERDKKDILRWLEYGIHVLALSNCCNQDHLKSAKEFLANNNARDMKIFAKIESQTGFENLNEILEVADGIIFAMDMFPSLTKEKTIELIRTVKKGGKPILLTKLTSSYEQGFEKDFEKNYFEYCKEGVDGVMLEPFVIEDEVFDIIEKTWSALADIEAKVVEKNLERFDQEGDFEVRDYIIYNAFRSGTEVGVKTAICFTENGYTATRFSSLIPRIPVITFTQSKDTYRYLSLVRGVKGYKISQSFNYENLKKIWKEMVRMIFKGNISLDDKVLILQANETISPEKNDMINGIELYNFKNI